MLSNGTIESGHANELAFRMSGDKRKAKMKILNLLFLMLLITGCATSYHPCGYTGGYSDMKLQDDIFKVSFRGNGYTGRGKASDLALLRCSELALENGYKYFVILGEDSDVQTSTYTTPTTANTQGSIVSTTPVATGGGAKVLGNSASYSSRTTYSGGETYHINKPSARMTIQCFKAKPENVSTLVYDAEQISANIKKAYKIR